MIESLCRYAVHVPQRSVSRLYSAVYMQIAQPHCEHTNCNCNATHTHTLSEKVYIDGETYSKANTCVIETRILPAVIHSDIIKSASEQGRFIQAINITVYSPMVRYYMAILRPSMFGRIIEHIKLHYIIKWPGVPKQRSH